MASVPSAPGVPAAPPPVRPAPPEPVPADPAPPAFPPLFPAADVPAAPPTPPAPPGYPFPVASIFEPDCTSNVPLKMSVIPPVAPSWVRMPLLRTVTLLRLYVPVGREEGRPSRHM